MLGKMKKGLCVLLVACMFITLLPPGAFASSDGGENYVQSYIIAEDEVNAPRRRMDDQRAQIAQPHRPLPRGMSDSNEIRRLADDIDDFKSGEVLAPAASLEEAQEIARIYRLGLKSYAYGIAVLVAADPELTVEHSRRMMGTLSSGERLPRLSLNHIYTTLTVAADTYTTQTVRVPDPRQWHHAEMDNVRAWQHATGAGVVVAVIDTGVDITHPAFTGRMVHPFNSYSNQTGFAYVNEDFNHGSHVSGIIATTGHNNVFGTAPDARIMPIKANLPHEGWFTGDAILRGINFAVQNGADIINLSLGRPFDWGSDNLEHQTIQDAVRAGVTVIAAAGNDRDGNADFPAAYSEVIAVSSTMEGYRFDRSYSNFGSQIDIAAPGTDIFAPVMGGGYDFLTGTSMAAPNVSGTAALILQRNPNFTPAQVRQALTETAKEAGQLGRNDRYGHGIVDSFAAMLGVGALHRVTYNFNNADLPPVVVGATPGGRLIQPSGIRYGDYWAVAWTLDRAGNNLFDFETARVNQDMTLYAVWGTITGTLPGDGVTLGAPWRLYGDGRLIVGAGSINYNGSRWCGFWPEWHNPWHEFRYDIHKIIFTGTIIGGESLSGLFGDLENVTTIEGLHYFDTSNVRDMSGLFFDVPNLASVDLSGWDTGNVTDMQSMFAAPWGRSSGLTSIEGISDWDTGNVTNMINMFLNATRLTSLDLSGWDTSSVTEMFQMFRYAHSLTAVGDLSGWDVSNVRDMSAMFWQTVSLEKLNLSGWDVSNVTNMQSMIGDTSSLTSLDVSGWDTSNVTNMLYMFVNTQSLSTINGISDWDTSSVTNMWQMFKGTGLASLDLSGWDTSSVTDMEGMFTGATSLRRLTLGANFKFVQFRWSCCCTDWRYVYADADLPLAIWRNVGEGTIYDPQGTFVLRSEQLMDNEGAAALPDTWIWQEAIDPLPFTDVFFRNWFYNAVRFAYENNIVSGTSDTTFSPELTMSRAMMVTILYNLAGRPSVTTGPIFYDVAPGAWYADAIVWASENGIVAGVGGNNFAPGANINREQLATIMRGFAEFQGIDVTPHPGPYWNDFTDRNQISDWAFDSLMWANYHRLVNGMPGPVIAPAGNASRAQAVAIIMNFMGAFGRQAANINF